MWRPLQEQLAGLWRSRKRTEHVIPLARPLEPMETGEV